MDDRQLSKWLELRERADGTARAASLVEDLAARLPKAEPMAAVDLATGAGSNLRYLIPRLARRQRWLAVDRSPLLLDALALRTAAWARASGYQVHVRTGGLTLRGPSLDCDIELRQQSLERLDPRLFDGRHFVTASALLDLVSASWLRTVAGRCSAAGASALFTITYDGRFACSPADPEDERVRDWFNLHQRRDKGLGGPAEGPAASLSAERAFAGVAYSVRSEPSDWQLGPDQPEMQQTLIDGWAEAVLEVAPEQRRAILDWRARRLALVEAGRSAVVVGHRDLAAWP